MEWVRRPGEAIYAKIGKIRNAPPNDLNIPRNYIKGSKKGESKNQENVKYGVGRISGVRGSIRLVKLLCLLLARCFLDAYGPKM